MTIRHAAMEDLKAVTELEAKCFPAAEAAGREAFFDRLASFPGHFWLLYEGEKLVSMINGMATDEEHLTDAMYEHADMHSRDGAWQMIFGVATDPAEQGKGYAAALMRRVIADTKSRGKKGLVLTCKERLLSFYGQFGYRNEGVSRSEHGGAVWYEMRLIFLDKEKNMEEYLIKNTTREQREQIVKDSLGYSELGCDDAMDGYDMYLPYIEGIKELREITMEYQAQYVRDMEREERGRCNLY